MTRRPTLSAKTLVTVAIIQAGGAAGMLCPLCREWLHIDQPRRIEHMVPLALGGSHEPENLRFVHRACALKKDFGRSKATCADGDVHRIRKADRIRRGGKTVTRPMAKGHRPFVKRADPWQKEWRAKRV